MVTRIEQLRSLVKQHDDLNAAKIRVEREIAKFVPSYRTTAVSQARGVIKKYEEATLHLSKWNAQVQPSMYEEGDDYLLEDED